MPAPSTRTLDRGGARPLWAQLQADLQRRVDSGEFAAAFPPELTLVEQYGVSRHTVREALRRFRAEGVVISARGRAPRLAGPVDIQQPLGAIYSLFAAVEATGAEQRSIVRALDVRTDGAVASRLELAASTPLLHLERLRLAAGEPLALDRVWLPASLAGALLDADFGHTALYLELDRRCGIRLTGGEEHLRAVVPSSAERTLLGLGQHAAALAIDRLGRRAEEPLELRQTLVRGDRFSVTAQFSAGSYRLDLAHQEAPRAAARRGSPRPPRRRGAPRAAAG